MPFSPRTDVLFGESGGHVAEPFQPLDVAWHLFEPEVIEQRWKQKQSFNLVGSNRLTRQAKAREDQDRTQWHMRRRFHKTVGAVLAEGDGDRGFNLIGQTLSCPEILLAKWTYQKVSEEVGWTETV